MKTPRRIRISSTRVTPKGEIAAKKAKGAMGKRTVKMGYTEKDHIMNMVKQLHESKDKRSWLTKMGDFFRGWKSGKDVDKRSDKDYVQVRTNLIDRLGRTKLMNSLSQTIQDRLTEGQNLRDVDIREIDRSIEIAMAAKNFNEDLKGNVGELESSLAGGFKKFCKANIDSNKSEDKMLDDYLNALKRDLDSANFPRLVSSRADPRTFLFITEDGKLDQFEVNHIRDLGGLKDKLDDCTRRSKAKEEPETEISRETINPEALQSRTEDTTRAAIFKDLESLSQDNDKRGFIRRWTGSYDTKIIENNKGHLQNIKNKNLDFKLPKRIIERLEAGKYLSNSDISDLKQRVELALHQKEFVETIATGDVGKLEGDLIDSFKGMEKKPSKKEVDHFLYTLKRSLALNGFPRLVTKSANPREFLFYFDGKPTKIVVRKPGDLDVLQDALKRCTRESKAAKGAIKPRGEIALPSQTRVSLNTLKECRTNFNSILGSGTVQKFEGRLETYFQGTITKEGLNRIRSNLIESGFPRAVTNPRDPSNVFRFYFEGKEQKVVVNSMRDLYQLQRMIKRCTRESKATLKSAEARREAEAAAGGPPTDMPHPPPLVELMGVAADNRMDYVYRKLFLGGAENVNSLDQNSDDFKNYNVWSQFMQKIETMNTDDKYRALMSELDSELIRTDLSKEMTFYLNVLDSRLKEVAKDKNLSLEGPPSDLPPPQSTEGGPPTDIPSPPPDTK